MAPQKRPTHTLALPPAAMPGAGAGASGYPGVPSAPGAAPPGGFAAIGLPLPLGLQQQAPAVFFGQQYVQRGAGGGGGTFGAATTTIDQYYLSRHCAVCDGLTSAQQPLCESCKRRPQVCIS